MDIPAFIRQNETPLYPKILWNRPVSRRGAGRLLIPGGHTGEFSLPSSLFQAAEASGIGECTVAFPDALIKFLSGASGATFVPSSTSGSLGQEASGLLLHLAEDFDAMLLGASMSNHSQTTILLETLVRESPVPLILIDDAIALLEHQADLLVGNENHLLLLTMPQVFKLAGRLGVPIHIKPNGGLINKLEIVRDISAASKCSYVIWGSELIVAVPDRELIVTPMNHRLSLLPAVIYGALSAFWIQNSGDRRAGLATASYLLKEVGQSLPEQSRPTLTAALKLLRIAVETAENNF
jgi:NAD(P)H-hydrate repair Nnr-like enzyme with NAD(P)H-hydrate dehydratase domain